MADHGYSAHFIRFVRVPLHAEAYLAAYYDQSGTSTNELRRLHREFMTLPPRHICSCIGHHCRECARIQASLQVAGQLIEIGHSQPVHPPMPSVLMLDLRRALCALGHRASPKSMAYWLSA